MTDHDQTRQQSNVRFFRLAHFKWLVLVVALLVTYKLAGTPHLLFQYQWNGSEHSPRFWRCDYVGQHSQRIVPHDGKCPLIRFFKHSGDDHGRG